MQSLQKERETVKHVLMECETTEMNNADSKAQLVGVETASAGSMKYSEREKIGRLREKERNGGEKDKTTKKRIGDV